MLLENGWHTIKRPLILRAVLLQNQGFETVSENLRLTCSQILDFLPITKISRKTKKWAA